MKKEEKQFRLIYSFYKMQRDAFMKSWWVVNFWKMLTIYCKSLFFDQFHLIWLLVHLLYNKISYIVSVLSNDHLRKSRNQFIFAPQFSLFVVQFRKLVMMLSVQKAVAQYVQNTFERIMIQKFYLFTLNFNVNAVPIE